MKISTILLLVGDISFSTIFSGDLGITYKGVCSHPHPQETSEVYVFDVEENVKLTKDTALDMVDTLLTKKIAPNDIHRGAHRVLHLLARQGLSTTLCTAAYSTNEKGYPVQEFTYKSCKEEVPWWDELKEARKPAWLMSREELGIKVR